MKPKNILTLVLLLFVATSVAALAIQKARKGTSGEKAPASAGRQIVAYYFHGKARCPTCKKIEANAREAIDEGFAEDLKAGRLQWKVINFEAAENEHFAKDFDLVAAAVVIVETKDGKVAQWKNLNEVWEFVDDKPAFFKLVQTNVKDFLDGKADGTRSPKEEKGEGKSSS